MLRLDDRLMNILDSIWDDSTVEASARHWDFFFSDHDLVLFLSCTPFFFFFFSFSTPCIFFSLLPFPSISVYHQHHVPLRLDDLYHGFFGGGGTTFI